MRENKTTNCEECGHDLFELDGEFHCPACDSVSGFELTPDHKDEFTL